MRDEIVLNSGILQSIPPKDYRFPHRTFMEFFAANYIVSKKDWKALIDLYKQDSVRWKQTILLYMGLNENREYSKHILTHLKKDFETSQNKPEPNLLVFSALTECAVPDLKLANEILNLAEQFLTQNSLLPNIIEELGYIAANPRWAYAKRAKEILLNLLKHDLNNNAFQQTIFSLLHARDENIDQIIVDSLKKINLAEFFSNIDSNEKYFVRKLTELELSEKEKQNIVEGLKEAGNFELLSTLLVESADQKIREYASYALFRMSKLEGFFDFLDSMESGILDTDTKKVIDHEFSEWGWNWNFPKTENGKKSTFLICHYTAKWFKKNYKTFDKSILEQVNNRFRYLVTGLLIKRKIKFHEFNLIDFDNHETASLTGLKRHWQQKVNINNFWYKVCRLENGGFWVLVAICLYWLISFLGIVGFVSYWSGFTYNSFYNYLFDGFTANFLFIHFIGWYILSFIICSVRTLGHHKDRLVVGMLGTFIFFETIYDKNPHLHKLFFLLICGLSLGYLFLPFHNVFFNILFPIHFLFWGIILLDSSQINFALLYPEKLKKVYNFLKKDV